VIHTEKLGRDYGYKTALESLNLHVEPGEILGFLGPNGAGKSTTVKILTGMIKPHRGQATVAGFDIVTQALEAKKRIGYVPESTALYESLSADEFLELMSCFYHLDPDTARLRREELFDLLELRGASVERLAQFSKGMKQKVILAAALMHKPDVLFLDEPLDGLDANTAMIVKELLKRLASQGKTILFCSHILDVVERVCTRIVIINKGKQIAEGTSQAIAEQTGSRTLEESFAKLTGGQDAGRVTTDFLAALERV